MTAAAPAGEDRPGAGPRTGPATGRGELTIRISTAGISDTEVAAITVALVAATTTRAQATVAAGPPAWRQAGMLEAATDRRVRTPAELRHPA